MATPVISPYTFADLRTPKNTATNKEAIYQALIANGFTSAESWEDGSVPSALVEVETDALGDLQQATLQTLNSGFNDWASGDALTEHSRQIYENDRRAGVQGIGFVVLTDTGAGPFTFDPTSKSVSVGQGGLLFNGIADPTGTVTGQITLPQNGSIVLWLEAGDVGSTYNVAAGTINSWARGAMPGVTISNPSNWLSVTGAVQGADAEGDPSLKSRNKSQWATLGAGSPPPAYENWARAADVAITRVEVFTNLDMLDPGTVTVLIAGAAGALPPTIVLEVQNAIASAQIGGNKIPETARCIAASAQNNTIFAVGTLYVAAEYNTPAFYNTIVQNVLSFQEAMRIGAKVSYERFWQVVTQIAGLDPDVITDVSQTSPIVDVVQAYYQVAVFDLSGLQLISV